MTIIYDSRTGNVKRFVEKVLEKRPNWKAIQIDTNSYPYDYRTLPHPFHLLTYTTRFGDITYPMTEFIHVVGIHNIRTVASSGNRNWGNNFAIAADKIASLANLPSMKFELSGVSEDVDKYIKMLEDNHSVKQIHRYP